VLVLHLDFIGEPVRPHLRRGGRQISFAKPFAARAIARTIPFRRAGLIECRNHRHMILVYQVEFFVIFTSLGVIGESPLTQMRMKVCVALALLGTPWFTGVAANAQYYYGPAIAAHRLLCHHWRTVNFNFTAGITSMHIHLIMATVMGVE
jgi:hypothetical protein